MIYVKNHANDAMLGAYEFKIHPFNLNDPSASLRGIIFGTQRRRGR